MKLDLRQSPYRRYWALAVILALSFYVLLPQVGAFRSSWHLLGQPSVTWTATAISLTMLTYFTGALTYCLLAMKRIAYWPTLIMQFAAMFANRLLPAGIGAIGTNYEYLRHKRHSKIEAATVVAMNNFLGIMGHSLVVMLVIAVSGAGWEQILPDHGHMKSPVIKILVLVAVAATALTLAIGRHNFKRWLAGVAKQIMSYRYRPWYLLLALMSSMALTSGNVLCLVACALAVGAQLPVVVVLLVFTFGVSTGTATPIPGGLGGFEAGLTAGFIAYGVPPSSALAITLLYRLISYWLPLGFGALAFIISERRGLIPLNAGR